MKENDNKTNTNIFLPFLTNKEKKTERENLIFF